MEKMSISSLDGLLERQVGASSSPSSSLLRPLLLEEGDLRSSEDTAEGALALEPGTCVQVSLCELMQATHPL